MPRNSDTNLGGQWDHDAQSASAAKRRGRSHDDAREVIAPATNSENGGHPRGATHGATAAAGPATAALTSDGAVPGNGRASHRRADAQITSARPSTNSDGRDQAVHDTQTPFVAARGGHYAGDTHAFAAPALPSPRKRGRPRKAVNETSPNGPAPDAGAQIAGHASCDTHSSDAGTDDGQALSGTHQSDAVVRTKRKAIRHSIPAEDAPSASGETGAKVVAPPIHVPPQLAATIAEIRALHRRRRFAMDQRKRMDNATLAYLRVTFGYRLDAPAEDRKAIAKRAMSVVAAVESVKVDDPSLLLLAASRAMYEVDANALPLVGDIVAAVKAREPFDRIESDASEDMEKLARTLPGYAFVKGVKGFGDLSFARLVGEAGDIGSYANPAKLWKRMGLAVMDGKRQGNPGKDATAEDWTAHGYSKRRRSESWNVAEPLFKHQWRGEKDGEPAHAIGPYGALYAERKAYLQQRMVDVPDLYPADDWPPGRSDKNARRYVEKRVLLNLWQAWRKDVRNS